MKKLATLVAGVALTLLPAVCAARAWPSVGRRVGRRIVIRAGEADD